MAEHPLPPPRRGHLERITGSLGIWQHARRAEPDPAHGTCTDDVARALTVDLLQSRSLGWAAVAAGAHRSMAYLAAAFDPVSGTFRDFRDAAGRWLDLEASQDCQGRALLSLGIAAREASEERLRHEARALFVAAVPGATRLSSPRAVASVIVGCDAALDGMPDARIATVFTYSVRVLYAAFVEWGRDPAWPWPERELTYENALLPRALIVAGERCADPALLRRGLDVLDWLVAGQTTRRGMFTPVGNAGWWPRGGSRSRYGQQPIEATATILAASAAYTATDDPAYLRAAEAAYAWFLGENEGGVAIAVPATGGCHDGLEEDGVNENQGAESTLMWLTAVETIRAMRARARTMAARPTADRGLLAGAVRS